MNNHTYSLDYVLLTLKLVIKYLNFDEEDIFRYGSDKDQPPLQALKDYIGLILNKQKSKDSLPEFIFDYNNTPENIEKKLVISPNTLSKLSQEVMINGCLLDKNNLKVLTAWTLLCHELYTPWTLLNNSAAFSNTAQTKPKAFLSYLTENKFQHVFNSFLNTLCAIGHPQTAEALHLFLYLTHLVTLHEKNNLTTKKGIANIQSICLTNALELENVLSTIDPPNPNTQYTALLKQENVLFSEMIGCLTNCKQFKKPFSKGNYQPNLSTLFNTTYEKMIASVWNKPNIAIIPYSHDIFVTTPESNQHRSVLPFILEKNSETTENDCPTRTQSPRPHKKIVRNKRSFDFPKMSKSDDPLSKARKINRETKSFSQQLLDITGEDKEKTSSSLTHRSYFEESRNSITRERSSTLPSVNFDSEPTILPLKTENMQKRKSSVHRGARTLDKLETPKKSHDNHSPLKPASSFTDTLSQPSQAETDELIQILQDLTFNTSESIECDDFYHDRRKNSIEKKSECEPLLHQYASDAQLLTSRKTHMHSAQHKPETPQNIQNLFLK